jgi:hypothetical protein
VSLDEATSAYVRDATARLRGLLSDDLIGVYLMGSGAMGGFDPRTSDVDMAAVVRGPLTQEQKQRIIRALAHPAFSCPVRKLELVVYGAEAVTGPTPSLLWELNLNTGPEVGVEASFDPSAEPGHWFVLDVAMARRHARPLFGPPPHVVFGEIPQDRVLRALLGSAEWHLRNDPQGVQNVLNACRAWRWVEQASWSPKPEAARWARDRTDDAALVDAAVAVRDADGARILDPQAVERFVTHVVRRIERSLEG